MPHGLKPGLKEPLRNYRYLHAVRLAGLARRPFFQPACVIAPADVRDGSKGEIPYPNYRVRSYPTPDERPMSSPDVSKRS